MIKEYIKLIKCYIYKLDPLDYTYEQTKIKIKDLKQDYLCNKYHMPKDTKFTHKLKRQLKKQYQKNMVKEKVEIKTKDHVLKKQIKKFKKTKSPKDFEQIIYILLGIEKFKKLVLKLEDILTNKKQCKPGKYDLVYARFTKKNWNYHLSDKSRIDSLMDAKMNLLHNGEIHTKWLITITLINIILLTLSSLTLISVLVFKIHFFTWLLKNIIDTYCVMLQRYNWIKLTEVINKYDSNIDQSFKTMFKNLKQYRIEQTKNYKQAKKQFIKDDIKAKEDNLVQILTNEGMEGILNYTKTHPEDKELVLKILNNKLYGVKTNINVIETIKDYNLNNKIITRDVLTKLFIDLVKENSEQFVCSRLLYKTGKNKCASFNKLTHTIYFYLNNTISSAKKYYKEFVKCYNLDIAENEFVNMYIVWVLLHELDHVDKNYKINTHGDNYKLYLRVYKLDKYYKLIFNENELVSERIANTNATVNINNMIDSNIFNPNLKVFCNHQFNNIINNGYHFDKLIKCPIDKYFVKDTDEKVLVKKLYGYKLTEQQYKE